MSSLVSESNVVHANESSQSTSLPSAGSTCFIPLITSVTTLTACENNNRNVIAEADTQECDVPKFSVASPEGIPESSVQVRTLDSVKGSDECNSKLDAIRPLFKYIKNNKCQLCGFESKAKDIRSVRSHLFVHVTNKEFKCDACDKNFISLADLKKHRFVHQNVFPFHCDLCDKKYKMKYSLSNHKKKTHGESGKSKSEFCNKVLSTNLALKEHLRIHTGEQHSFVCGFCKKAFRREKTFTRHVRLHGVSDKTQQMPHGSSTSSDSSCSSAIVSSLNTDIEASSSSISPPLADPTSLIPLTGSVPRSSACESNCNLGGQACTQMSDVPQSGADSVERKPKIAVKTYSFKSFDNRCTVNTKLIRPLYKYMKDKKCLLCGFESKAKDLRRIRSHLFVHVTDRQFKCDTCEKKFREEYQLVRHRLMHKDVFPFPCDLCDKKYRNKYALRNHKKKKHGEKRTFKCEFCGKVLSSNFHLKEHLRVHTGERPYVCDLCKQSFRIKCYLLRHLRRHHAAD